MILKQRSIFIDIIPATGAYVPAAHGEQLPEPVASLYVPAPHARHAKPSASAVYPAMHVQSVSALLPTTVELVCAGHAKHAPAPWLGENVPASHGVQLVAPSPE